MQFRTILNQNLTSRHPVFLRHDTYIFCFNKESPPQKKLSTPLGVFLAPSPYIEDILNFPSRSICWLFIYCHSNDC